MAGLFGLSVNPEGYSGNFVDDLFWGTFYNQHLGEQFAGLSTLDRGIITARTHRGLFRPSFANDLVGLEGSEGIGYCGSDREPFNFHSRLGEASLCCSGNLVNQPQLLDQFKSFGHVFDLGGDIEVVAHLLAKGNGFSDGITKMDREIQGAITLLVISQDGIYAARGASGHWPLVIGKKEGAVAVASEPSGFCNLGFRLFRDVGPGEIVLLKNGTWKTVAQMPVKQEQICSFLWVYTNFPGAVIRDVPTDLVRRRLGACLARRDIERGFVPDVVIPVPDSGKFHAHGYHEAFCQAAMEGRIKKIPVLREILMKFPYAGRSFTPPNQEARDKEAQFKLLLSGEDYQGMTVVVCDDSIVRGTQTQTNLVPKLRSVGVKEIHLRISNPELRSHCPWGKTTKQGETLISRFPSLQDRIEFLGVDSLAYNAIDDLVVAIGLPRETLCMDCSLDPAV
jgi:amidophosphoribosyltransferase